MSHGDRPSHGGGATEGTLCTGAARYPGERGADSSSSERLGSYYRAADTLGGHGTKVAS